MTTRKLLGLVLAAGIALGVSSHALLAHEGEHGSHPMLESLKALKGKEFEVSYLKQMIHHHHMGVEMAELATKNTKRSELNELGKKIMSAQKAEIDQMTAWLKSWYGESPGSMEQMAGMDEMMKEMEAVKNAKDADFDKLFLDKMAHHHQGAVMMSKLVSERADHAELKQLAAKIIKDQEQEIAQLRSWEKSWFGSAQ